MKIHTGCQNTKKNRTILPDEAFCVQKKTCQLHSYLSRKTKRWWAIIKSIFIPVLSALWPQYVMRSVS